MSARKRERDGKGDDKAGEYAELPENWLEVAALAQDSFCLRSDDEHTPHDGNETDDQERLKDELCASQRESQRIEKLRNDEDEEHTIEDQEGRVDTALVNSLGNEPNGIGTDQGDGDDQDASKGDIEGDLEAVQHAAGVTNNTGQGRPEDVVA